MVKNSEREKITPLSDTERQKSSQSKRQSLTEGLTLEQYYFAVKTYCELNHKDCECCNITLLTARGILKEIYISLLALWCKVRADVPYDCEKHNNVACHCFKYKIKEINQRNFLFPD